MAAGAILLSYAAVTLDAAIGVEAVREFGWFYTFGPEGARALLSTVASSMVTVAALTFSITMLTLQLASTQFGPRLVRNVMRDRGTQAVLGTFVATFVYCLLVLRTVRGVEGASNVPHLSVAFGVLLALASLGVLIYFIHHVAHSLRVETILSDLASEACAAIDRLYPELMGEPAAPGALQSEEWSPGPEVTCCKVTATDSGYVQHQDEDALMRLAMEHDLFIGVEARPGRFVTDGDPLYSVWPRDRCSDEVIRALRTTVDLGLDRTPSQDVAFSARRIVEIAQRALSPGINDPTTALYCLDRLEVVLLRMAGRQVPSPLRLDGESVPRVLTTPHTLDELAYPALAAVARYGLSDRDVTDRLLALIDKLRHRASCQAIEQLDALAQEISVRRSDHLGIAPPERSHRAR
jgi:uncharacterized membrane protein